MDPEFLPYKKVYVDVILLHSKDTGKIPRTVIFNDGRTYQIDRMISRQKHCPKKIGGGPVAMRYTVQIGGKETYLFEDEDAWFVEARNVWDH